MFILIFILIFIGNVCAFANDLVVNEVMSYSTNDTYKEFIEIYNNGESAIDITDLRFSDGDGIDDIVPWDKSAHGAITDLDVIYNETDLPKGCYALILDSQYDEGDEPYDFVENTIIFTTNDTTLGGSGLAKSDPISVYNAGGDLISTYGTPVLTSSSTYQNADDDAMDSIPLSTIKGVSAERVSVDVEDKGANWKESIDSSGATPGYQNSVVTEDVPEELPEDEGNKKFVGIINEVMPNIGSDDWLEIYVKEVNGSIAGYNIYEGKSLVKTLPDIKVKAGDYIVLYFAKILDDELDDKGDNEFWDIYTDDAGLTATDNSIIIRDSGGKIIDFLSYAYEDGTWSQTNQTLFQEAVDCDEWVSNVFSQQGCAEWDKSYDQSLSRKYDDKKLSVDTNAKYDWHICEPTLGFGLLEQDVVGSKIDAEYKVLNTPFNPYGFSKHKEAKIIYNNPVNKVIKIKIYDVQGRRVRTLHETDVQGFGELYWDGSDDSGTILPIGVYVVAFEIVDKESGYVKNKQRLVVLGKRL